MSRKGSVRDLSRKMSRASMGSRRRSDLNKQFTKLSPKSADNRKASTASTGTTRGHRHAIGLGADHRHTHVNHGARVRTEASRQASAAANAGSPSRNASATTTADADVVRTRVYVATQGVWEPVARALGKRFGGFKRWPANTLVVAGLIGEGYLVEIEAEAVASEFEPHLTNQDKFGYGYVY